MNEQDKNRRRGARVPINEEFGWLPEATYISDLSESGLFVQTREPPELGSMVALKFTVLLEDPFVLEARGRVVRHSTEPPGMGVEFTDLSPETMLRINDVVTQQMPQDSGPPLTPLTDQDLGSLTPGTVSEGAAAKGQIPLGDDALEVRRVGSGTDEGDTSRYSAVGGSTQSGTELLASGEYQLVPAESEEQA